ncbi:MAG: DUF885 domain-containing protein, partial [Gammaproteobacteria bacterium]|nr:DUF885 domain-containing protein [Gammaproteobacteria bacterium]
MRKNALFVVFLLIITPWQAFAEPADDFRSLLDEHWEWQLREDPVLASRLGDRRYNDQWADMNLAAIERRYREVRQFLRRLQLIDSGRLSDVDRLNYDLFRRELEDEVDGHQFMAYLMPMSQRGGVQSLES